MAPESWFLYFTVALIATASPGPAVLLVIARSCQFGTGRAPLIIAGNISGLVLLSAAAALGLTAVFVASTAAFSLVKIAGAAYLIYLGLKAWRSAWRPTAPIDAAKPRRAGAYGEGLLMAITNPKAVLFTSALFPQFIDPSVALLPQFLIMVATLLVLSFTCLLAYAVLARRLMAKLSSRSWAKWAGTAIGGVYLGAGTALLLTTK